ncbi:hypothetical protein HID58_093993, partial [Brassica napus]
MITHLSCPKQAEESTGEEERCPEAPILFIYPKEACGHVEYDLVSKEITSPTESMQLSLKGTNISELVEQEVLTLNSDQQEKSDCEITRTAGAEQTKVSNLLPQVVSNNSEDMITHLSCPKQAEESTGEEERCPEAPILFIYPKEACGQSALETSVEYDLVSKEITSPTESMQLSLK